jgi:hypothetical protein
LNILVQHPGRQFKDIEGRRTLFTTAEEMETAAVAVKTVEAIEMVAVTVTTAAMMVKAAALLRMAMTVKAAAPLRMATTAESAETAAAVMSMAEKVAADVTNRKAAADTYRRELWCVSSISDVRIMWNITAPLVLPLEVAPPLIPVEELTRSSSPLSMLPEAVSEALGISLSKVLDLYFGELDEVRRGHPIGDDALDRRMLGEQDHKWLQEESRRRDAAEISSYQEDNKV